jgi:hypothetical protein
VIKVRRLHRVVPAAPALEKDHDKQEAECRNRHDHHACRTEAAGRGRGSSAPKSIYLVAASSVPLSGASIVRSAGVTTDHPATTPEKTAITASVQVTPIALIMKPAAT